MEYIFNNENEWLDFRKGKITGTIASAVVGLNPYLSNTEAYEIVSGIKEPKDISEKPYVVKGKKAEEHIRSLFILDHPDFEVVGNNYVDKYILVVDDENPFIACTPDGFIIEKETGRKVPYKIAKRREGDITTCYADTKKAKEELGWVAT